MVPYGSLWFFMVQYAGPGSRSVNLECLEYDPGMKGLVPGPWACRCVYECECESTGCCTNCVLCVCMSVCFFILILV